MDRNNESFSKIKSAVLKWIKENEESIKLKGVKIEETECNENIYKIFLDFKNCMGEVLVTTPEFAPYRFVSIQIASLKEIESHLAYFWYDNENSTVNDILYNLEKSINFGIEFE